MEVCIVGVIYVEQILQLKVPKKCVYTYKVLLLESTAMMQ